MATILDFFKPIASSKRRQEEAPVAPTSEGPTDAALLTASPSPSTRSRLRDNGLKVQSEMQKPLGKRKHKSQGLAATTGATDQEEEQFTELSAYEQKRLAKMAANAQFLQEVGMVSAQLNMTRHLQQEKASLTKPATHKRRPKAKLLREELPVRRSKRIRGEAAPGSQVPPRVKAEAEEPLEPEPLEVEASYAESKVLRYSVKGGEDTRKAPVSLLDSPDRDLVGFQVDTKSYLYDDSISKTYDISFTPFQDNGLVAAGGHGGLVSIFPFSNSFHQPEIVDGFVDDPGAHIPLMSFKAHNGWVSAVSLATSIQGKANLLLTASNDASVKLWDLNHSSALLNAPKLVFNNTNLHGKGIFGMDVCGDSVLTCSKDKTVTLSRFRDDTGQLEMTQRFEEHTGVVKCVRFARCNPQIFASAGNDRELRVFDVRVAMNPNVVTISGVHTRAINSVQFHPTDDNMLMSAGFDPDFYLFDLRNTSTPVCTFHQRDDTSKGIFHPIFVRSGLGVVAARGHYLSLYRTSDGVAISRGYIDAAATCIAADPFYDRITIAQGGKLQFADAKWKSTV